MKQEVNLSSPAGWVSEEGWGRAEGLAQQYALPSRQSCFSLAFDGSSLKLRGEDHGVNTFLAPEISKWDFPNRNSLEMALGCSKSMKDGRLTGHLGLGFRTIHNWWWMEQATVSFLTSPGWQTCWWAWLMDVTWQRGPVHPTPSLSQTTKPLSYFQA